NGQDFLDWRGIELLVTWQEFAQIGCQMGAKSTGNSQHRVVLHHHTIIKSVVMVAWCVDVAVVDLFFRGFPDTHHFHIEMQRLTRHLVVAINHHLVTFHCLDSNLLLTALTLSREDHAWFNVFYAAEH